MKVIIERCLKIRFSCRMCNLKKLEQLNICYYYINRYILKICDFFLHRDPRQPPSWFSVKVTPHYHLDIVKQNLKMRK